MTSFGRGFGASLRTLAGRWARRLVAPLEGVVGPIDSWVRHLETVREDRTISDAVNSLRRRTDTAAFSHRGPPPVFVLASSWRSGSTLLQRLICSGGETLIWGEPYAHSAHVRRLAEALLPITREYPPDDFFPTCLEPGAVSDAWIANMYPPLQHLMSAHRTFFEKLFWTGAREAGYRRWGFKSVLLDGDHARYLSVLFPEAKYVVLIRDPYEAFRSYRRWLEWYQRWPDQPVFTATQFGRMWRQRTASLLDASGDLDALVVRYDELTSEDGTRTVTRIAEHLETEVASEALTVRIPAKGSPQQKVDRLPWIERAVLSLEVKKLRSTLGFGSPSSARDA